MMGMQSQEEIERICYQNELDRAEAWANEHYSDDDLSPRECFDNCVHAAACYRLFYAQNDKPEDVEEAIADFLEVSGCADECDEYEDAWCPMSLSGTMRCQGPKRIERENHS